MNFWIKVKCGDLLFNLDQSILNLYLQSDWIYIETFGEYVEQENGIFIEIFFWNVLQYNILIVFKNIRFAKKKKFVYVCATKEFRDGRNSFLF